MKRKILIILSSVILTGVVFSVLASAVFQYRTGVVTKITAKASDEDNLELKIACFLPVGGYAVREVPKEEGEYCGDGIKDYDGAIGEYRIIIEFGDIAPHESFVKEVNNDGVFEIKNDVCSLKAKIACPSDHGFVLYVGSNIPIYVESSSGNNLNGFFGTIHIPIVLGDK